MSFIWVIAILMSGYFIYWLGNKGWLYARLWWALRKANRMIKLDKERRDD